MAKRRKGGRPKDPCCVLTAELAPLIQSFAERWTREHEDLAAKAAARGGLGGRQNALGHFHGNAAVGAITIIHERTRMINGGRGGRGGRGVGPATIRNVLQERNKTTELWIADSLLCAIREAGALSDGRVRVIPNPTASERARAAAARRGMPECC